MIFMDGNALKMLMENHDMLDAKTLHELSETVERYPYFNAARLLYLINLYKLNDIRFTKELKKAALCFSDRSILFRLTDAGHFEQKPQELTTELKQKDRTISLIDSFLSSQPASAAEGKDIDVSTDYISYMLKEEKGEMDDSSHQNMITELLQKRKSEDSDKATDDAPQQTSEDSYFTETLAKIYIKQQRYDKALEIIKKLSLKFPKKNTYFADQIRFLEKLINNNNTTK